MMKQYGHVFYGLLVSTFLLLVVFDYRTISVYAQESKQNTTTTTRARKVIYPSTARPISNTTTTTRKIIISWNSTRSSSFLNNAAKSSTKSQQTTTSYSNEKAYDLLNKQAVEASVNSSTSPEISQSSNNTVIKQKDDEIEKTISDESSSFFSWWSSFLDRIWNQFDRQTGIMVTAFFTGLFLVALFIAITICICKRMDESRKIPTVVLVNPAYDKLATSEETGNVKPNGSTSGGGASGNKKTKKKKPIETMDFLDDNVKSPLMEKKGEQIEMIDMSSPEVVANLPEVTFVTPKSLSTTTSSSSSSTTSPPTSVDSKPIITSPATPVLKNNNNNNTPVKAIDSIVNTPTTTNNKDVFTEENETFKPKYTPSYIKNSQSQLNRDSRGFYNSNGRLDSESSAGGGGGRNNNSSSKRPSIAASSSSSLSNFGNQVQLNLDIAKEGVNQIANDILPPGARDSSVSAIATSRTSLHNSYSDIYIKAFIEADNKKKSKMRPQVNE